MSRMPMDPAVFQLTRGDKSSTNPRWSPDGQWIAFGSSRSDTKNNIFRIRVSGGEAEQLTSEKGSPGSFDWSPDGQVHRLHHAGPKTEDEEKAAKEKRDARVIDEHEKLNGLYVMPVEKNADRQTAVEASERRRSACHGFDWSPDSKTIVFSHQRNPKVFEQNDISTVSVDGGAIKPLVATPASETVPIFSRDGRSIAYTCHATIRRRGPSPGSENHSGKRRPAARACENLRRAAGRSGLDGGRPRTLHNGDSRHDRSPLDASGRRRGAGCDQR